ncbi:MAG: PAS domain-containing protein [Bacteroidales bacterium]
MVNEKQESTYARMLRLKAEKLLKEKQKSSGIPSVASDDLKLFHELQVHKIELEMQNEELQEAYEAQELVLKKYTMLYDLAPMGFFTLNGEGVISELNYTAAGLLGEKRISLIGTNIRLFIHENSLPLFNVFLSKVFTGYKKESCRLMLFTNNNHQLEVYMEGIVAGEEEQCLLSVVDISGFAR